MAPLKKHGRYRTPGRTRPSLRGWFLAALRRPSAALPTAEATPVTRNTVAPHSAPLCLPEGDGWLCRYPFGDGHRVHTPYAGGEYLVSRTATPGETRIGMLSQGYRATRKADERC